MINPIERITQNRIIQLFQEQLGYSYYGNWEKREHNSNVEQEILKRNLLKRGYSETLANKAVKEVYDLANTNAGGLYQRNKEVYSLLRYGVKARPELGENFETIFPIDWQNWQNNEFGIAEEVTLAKGQNVRRPDIVLYVNGIALGVLELKRGTIDISESIRQSISNQKELFNEWFYSTVQFLFAGNNTQGLRYGTIETPDKYFLSWKEDEQENEDYKLDKYLKKLCDKQRLLDIIYNGVVFDAGVKKLPRPHQYFALQEAQPFIKRREGGIIWHTQGSGKSLMMVMLGKWILENVANSRIVILTDRTELDDQIERVFNDVGETDIAKTKSGKELMDFLTSPRPRLVCSLIHKFGNKTETDFDAFIKELQDNPVKTQGEIFVFIDECHRTQSGKLNQVMKAVLQNAVFIGFTGTPLLKEDKKTTMDVFGRYIHTYKFNEAVEDGVVKDLMYEGRNIEQNLTSQAKIDQWFESKTAGLNDFQRNELKKKWGTMQNVLSSKSRMEKIVADIIFDFQTKTRLRSQMGNAILVASSIYEACKYYNLFLQSELKNKCAIITSYNPNMRDVSTEDTGADTETDKEYIFNTYTELLKEVQSSGNKSKTETYESESKERFRKEPAKMKLLIVVSKLLTGFDAPPCSYIYIDKKMQDHTLFQAICRVNRLDTDDKDYGYIVDYMELFGNVTDAINVYTSELDSEGFTKEEVEINLKDRLKIAVDRLLTALETVEFICESVEFPKADIDFIRYFCGNTENPEDLKSNEYKRMALYKAIVEYIRAYANLKADFVNTTFTEAEVKRFHQKMEDYLNLREIIRKASGETIDLKAYEADMRFLIDTYIKAEESEKVSPFDDISLLDLMETDMEKAIDSLPKGIKGNKEAVAETIENNVRSKIVEEHLLDPKYFDQMSVLLQELIERRKQETVSYQEYLVKMAELIRQVNRGKKDDIPVSLNTKGKVALYHTLGDEEMALACEEAVQYVKQEGFRENLARQRMVKKAIFDVVKDIDKVEEVYKIIEAHKDEY
ncbi:HsdR family type I site-specific deoxyribonuclease [Myroides odoratimimus]|uniref:type I restriction endonuclease subunit R n=1 Tax=Myroides odoratimimus TaxID=76832 RepID=UPI00103F0630|nr:HsdR family type I site-specific deoxyribonuclease [Myroides odoratimimus]QBK76673.1 HsdR family type I site-specific deoxyribonuclease [Myroides odoratimimus]WHT72085.1 HsdR family type I site-specific deoxyribonuclease [Myroides odoratimimus]WHU36667.1 HsdR family type I site-specific deoxyribonuclease [Myroides odoratimimus]